MSCIIDIKDLNSWFGVEDTSKERVRRAFFLVYSPGLCGMGKDDSLRDAMLLCAWFTTRTVDKSIINPTDPIVVFFQATLLWHTFLQDMKT